MRKKINFWIAGVLLIAGFAACDKTEETFPDNSIEGKYVGTLTNEETKSAAGVITGNASATADVTIINDEEIEVHCYGEELDTTFMLNYYENHDSVMVCLTGNAFEEMYGHMLGQGHMMGGMMGDIHNDETEWMHHLNDEHHSGDEHFGGFDTMSHTFGYWLTIPENGTLYRMRFQGSKSH